MKRNIHIMYAIALLQGMVFYAPIATLYRQARGLGLPEIALIESISYALGMALEIPWGAAADRIGCKQTMVLCCGLYFASKIVFLQAESFAGFLAERILLSIVMAGLSGVDATVLYRSCETGDSQRVFGYYEGAGTAGLLTATAVFSLFVKDDYRLAAVLTVFSYGLAAALSLFLKEVTPEEREEHQPIGKLLKSTLKDRALLPLLLGAALLGETAQYITVFLNQPHYMRCGLNESTIGVLYIISTVLSLAGVYSAALCKRAGRKNAVRLIFLGCAAACVIPAVTADAGAGATAILTISLLNSLLRPLEQEMENRLVSAGNRATALSVNAMLADCVSIVMNLIFGFFSGYSLSATFLFGCAACVTGLTLFGLCLKRRPELQTPEEKTA